jgi:hypothetical protein
MVMQVRIVFRLKVVALFRRSALRRALRHLDPAVALLSRPGCAGNVALRHVGALPSSAS